jgi:hypothetical protein
MDACRIETQTHSPFRRIKMQELNLLEVAVVSGGTPGHWSDVTEHGN